MSKTALLFAGQGAQVVGMGQDLAAQVTAPVRWEASMRHLLAQGFTRFIELGPGTALSGFLKRIDRSAKMSNVAGLASLDRTVAAWSGGPA